jgi:Zn-dependent M28 family amino/carboxypeptidase
VRQIEEDKCSLALIRDGNPEPLKLGTDANLGMRGDPAPHVEAEAVFVGYGLQVPELKFDELAGLDLRGKIAVYLYGAPAFIPGPLAAHVQSAERSKRLRAAGAIGTAAIRDPRNTDVPWARATLARLQPSMSLIDPVIEREDSGMRLGISINPEHADKWFKGTNHTLSEILAAADANKPLPKFPLKIKVRADTAFRTSEIASDNVAGVLPGSDPQLKNEYVVLSAHLDHLGIGGEINGDRIYNGAMDNASGVASLIEIARNANALREHPKRSLLFVAVTGEEKGLLGSKYFAYHPTVPADQMVANINVDMFLPIIPLHSVVVYGLDESDLGDLSREVAAQKGIGIAADREPKRNLFVRSDQYNFIRHGVPALSFKFNAGPGTADEKTMKEWIRVRYHAPSDDTKQPVDIAAAARFNDYIMALMERVADRPERPQWKQSSFFRRFAAHKS